MNRFSERKARISCSGFGLGFGLHRRLRGRAWDGKNRHVIIINDTSEYMTELYASNIQPQYMGRKRFARAN